MNKYFFKNQKGFTLIETLFAVSIFTVVMVVVGMFTRNVFSYRSIFAGGLSAYDDARNVLRPMASEIRSMSQSSIGSYPIETAGDNTLTFYSDTNNDGLRERIRYFLDNGTLKKGTIIPTGNPLVYAGANEKIKELVHNVKNNGTPIFNYYDTNYNGDTPALTQPVNISAVRLIKMTLIVDSDTNRSPIPITVTTQVNIRNLKDNL